MKKILAFVWLAIKTACRSKLVMCLAILLFTALIVLASHVEGDGTINGYVRVLLTYTLSFSMAILAVATMWACSCSISNEVSSGRIHVVVTKPVRSYEIWLGTWLGSLILNAVFLAISLLLIWGYFKYTNLQKHTKQNVSTTSLREVLIGRTSIAPRTDDVEEDIKRWQTAAIQQGRKYDYSFADKFRRHLLARNSVVNAGNSKKWTFDVNHQLRFDEAVLLQIHFSTPSVFVRKPVSGVWTITSDQYPDKFYISMTNYPSGKHTLTIPGRFVPEKGTVYITFLNSSVVSHDTDSVTDTVIFHPEEGIRLLVPNISFEANLIRTGLVLLARLALLSAVAIALSALFSAPVAVLATFSVVVLTMAANFFLYVQQQITYTGEDHEHEIRALKSTIIYKVAKEGLLGLGKITEPVLTPCISEISRGLTIHTHSIYKAWFIAGLLYPALLCIISCLVMSRRELALSCQRGI